MTSFVPTFSYWLYGANVCFFLAACAKDVLILRTCLVGAYINIIINSITGLPGYGQYYSTTGSISIDGVVAGVIIGSIHLQAIWRLLKDEEVVPIRDDLIPLWRLFHRRCGIHRHEFNALMEYATIKEFKPGDYIASIPDHKTYVYFVIKGVVSNVGVPYCKNSMETHANQDETVISYRYSGTFLCVRLFSLFGVPIGENYTSLKSVAKTQCTILIFSLSSLKEMSARPAMTAAWKNMLLFQLAMYSRANITRKGKYCASTGQREPDSFYEGDLSLDFGEFSAEEIRILQHYNGSKSNIFLKAWMWLKKSFSPCLASGIRHGSPVPLNSFGVKKSIVDEGDKIFEAGHTPTHGQYGSTLYSPSPSVEAASRIVPLGYDNL